jgi:hypothetical protein
VRLILALAIAACACTTLLPSLVAQSDTVPTARLRSAPRLTMPAAVDSNMPMTWDRVDGRWQLSALVSWGGIPALLAGPDIDSMSQIVDSVALDPHPGDGIWFEAVIADESGAWYGFYHHELPAHVCGQPERSIPRVGMAVTSDRGRTWNNLGIVLEAPPGSYVCDSPNRYVIGGVGDLSVMLDARQQDLFLFFSQYSRDPAAQGVAVARLAWADRDAPQGRVSVWSDGAWIPPRRVDEPSEDGPAVWEYPAGSALVPVTEPWHDADPAVNAFWGPSVHWNTYLERYVMLLNRSKNERFDNEGIYVSYARTLTDPAAWSEPRLLMKGGGWYPQVAGLTEGAGTDKLAGQRARFFLTGRSDHLIEFTR